MYVDQDPLKHYLPLLSLLTAQSISYDFFVLTLIFIIPQVQQLQSLREPHLAGQLVCLTVHEMDIHTLVCNIRYVVDLGLNAFKECRF